MKKYNRLNIIAMLLILLSIGNVKAQETMPVNMEAVLKLAGANNLTIKKYELKYQQALADQSKAKEWWLPNIYAGTATHYLNGAAMNANGKIFTNVNRNNLWAGLGIAAEIDFSKGVYQTLAAKQKAVAANYFNKAEKNKAILQAIETYYDLQVAQLNYLFLQRMTNQSDTLSQQLKIKMEAGLLYQSEYLLSQSNFQHIKIIMLQAKVDWQKKSALLINLLNLANTIKLVIADTSLMPLPFSAPSVAEKGFKKGLNIWE